MLDAAPDPETVAEFDPGPQEKPKTSRWPQAPEQQSEQADRVVAYLRSAMKATLEPEAKQLPERRFWGFLRRKRPIESAVGIRVSLAPKAQTFDSGVPEWNPEAAREAPAVPDEAAEPQFLKDDGSAPVLAENPTSEFGEQEPSPPGASEWAAAEGIADDLLPGSAEISEEPGDRESTGAIAFSVEPAISIGAEPALSDAPTTPVALHGEVLPPEGLRSESSSSPTEPARVITMQPVARTVSGETSPASGAGAH